MLDGLTLLEIGIGIVAIVFIYFAKDYILDIGEILYEHKKATAICIIVLIVVFFVVTYKPPPAPPPPPLPPNFYRTNVSYG